MDLPTTTRRDFVALRRAALARYAAEIGVHPDDVPRCDFARRLGLVSYARLTAQKPSVDTWRALHSYMGAPAPAPATKLERVLADIAARPGVPVAERAAQLGVSPATVSAAAKRAGVPSLRARILADIAATPDESIAARARRLGVSRQAISRAIAEKSRR